MIKKILTVIYNFFRGTVRLIINLIILFLTRLMWALTKNKNRITRSKLRRVRFFTKVKLFLLKYTPRLVSFLGWKTYFEEVKKKFSYEL